MRKQKRYITFYKLDKSHRFPCISTYGMMCTRNWWDCFKMGMKHIRKGKAYFFTIKKIVPKSAYFPIYNI